LKEYFIDQDQDCHWYVVDNNFREEWQAWCNLDSEEDDAAHTAPAFAIYLGTRPNKIVFSDWRDV